MVKLREVLLLIGEDDVVLWSDASDSPVALPDSRLRWEHTVRTERWQP